MSEKELSSSLLKLLSKIDFSQKYYDQYVKASKAIADNKRNFKFSQEDFASALASTSLDFKYNKKENFFSHKETHGEFELGLNIAFPYNSMELILLVKNELERTGGPFPKLAREVAQLSNPDFKYSPASPKIPFSNQDELSSSVKFGVSLFEDIKQAFLSDRQYSM